MHKATSGGQVEDALTERFVDTYLERLPSCDVVRRLQQTGIGREELHVLQHHSQCSLEPACVTLWHT